MPVAASAFALAFCFNAYQEALGPANAGWIAAWPSFMVAAVVPGTPMDKAGLRKGDVLEAVNGHPLTGMPDWFVARSTFERDRSVEIQIRRSEQRLRLRFVITLPAWRTWRTDHALAVLSFYLARFILLLLAIFISFRRPKQLSASLAALMFASTAVAEGYPSSGWAASLHRLPLFLAIPICLATASWLLGSVVWVAFFGIFPRRSLTRRWQWALLLAPLLVLLPPLVKSATALVIAPWDLTRSWPLILSVWPARIAQDLAGVAPLLFFNLWPLDQPITQVHLLELWLFISGFYLAAGFALLTVNFRRGLNGERERLVRNLLASLVIFPFIVVHNVFARNWASWFGTATPPLLSSLAFVAEAVLFLIVPLTLTCAVLAERQEAARDGNRQASPADQLTRSR